MFFSPPSAFVRYIGFVLLVVAVIKFRVYSIFSFSSYGNFKRSDQYNLTKFNKTSCMIEFPGYKKMLVGRSMFGPLCHL